MKAIYSIFQRLAVREITHMPEDDKEDGDSFEHIDPFQSTVCCLQCDAAGIHVVQYVCIGKTCR